jgi:hypothetical protein
MSEFQSRIEVFKVTHNWPVIMLFILTGSLIGWAIAMILPAPYRAESSLHVSYNSDIHARNIDDFKNWQMGELNIFIFSPVVLEETMNKLRAQDPYWNSVSPEELRSALNVYWRNVGEWRLVAKVESREHAEQLVETWKQVILEQAGIALSSARSTLELETQIKAISLSQVDIDQRAAELRQIKESLQSWKTSLDQQAKDNPLSELERWYLNSQVARIVTLDPLGALLMEQIPPLESPASEYLPWLDRALAILDRELLTVEDQSAQLSSQYDALYEKWAAQLAASNGLTAYLAVESLDSANHQTQSIRSTSTMAFVGGLLGLLAWGLIWLARPIRQTKTQAQ